MAPKSGMPSPDQDLMATLWDPRVKDDPLRFVMLVYPWGRPGTPLERYEGPRRWQREDLSEIAEHIAANKERVARGLPPLMFRKAMVAGRGPGKSTIGAWLDWWFLSTRIGGTSIVTANTEIQLKTRTWAEVGKWHTLAINGHWFERSALSVKPAPWFGAAVRDQLKIDTGYYYAQAQLWSEENPDAFAGAHNPLGMMLRMDEASGIPASIWKVCEGMFTEPEAHRFWLVWSNGRRNTGTFYDLFHGPQRDRWRRRHLDSRTVEGVDRAVLDEIVATYGEDSDEARVEVKGEFPRQGENQFIGRDVIEAAVARELAPDEGAALVMGVDPARGGDKTVIRFRRGRDARSIPPVKLRSRDDMETANECARLIELHGPDAVCIDAGNGTGVIDRLRELKYRVHEVWFGASKGVARPWANRRTELWALMRDWLKGGCIDADRDLVNDLAAPNLEHTGVSDLPILESKDSMRNRGVASPDDGDALACTFAVRVARRDMRGRGLRSDRARTADGVDYAMFA